MHKEIDRFRDKMRDTRKSYIKPTWVPEASWKTMSNC